MTLYSQRLFFRPLCAGDATQQYAEWLNDPEVNRYLETRHSEQTIESCKLYVSESNEDENCHLFGMFTADTQEHIGNIKIGFINRNYMTGQLSLFIGDKSQWGKGYATEAVAALTRHAFEELQLERVEAGCYEENFGSLKAFLKAGYSVEGFARKHVVVNGERQGCFWLAALKNE